MDRLNLNVHMNVIDKLIIESTSYKLNDEHTRIMASFIIENYLDHNDIYDYIVVCDERNNPPNIIDKSILIYEVIIYNDDSNLYIFRRRICDKNGKVVVEVII